MEDRKKKALLEALLFLSGDPVMPSTLKAVSGLDDGEIKRLMDEIITDYTARDGGILIAEIAAGYQMITNPDYAAWIRKFDSTMVSNKLSAAALETLAIIAYKQPMIKAEVEQIRGANSDGVVKTLLDRRLIKIVGKKEAPGKPMLYGTTNEFLQYFGLKNITELPTLRELAREDTI